MKRLMIAAALILLSGCASRQPLTTEQIVAKYAPLCDQIGFAVNTDQWRNCILGRYDADLQDRAMRRAAALSAYGNGLNNRSQEYRPRLCTYEGNRAVCN